METPLTRKTRKILHENTSCTQNETKNMNLVQISMMASLGTNPNVFILCPGVGLYRVSRPNQPSYILGHMCYPLNIILCISYNKKQAWYVGRRIWLRIRNIPWNIGIFL